MASTTSARFRKPDPEELRAAVADADLRVLLMCLVHLTGDRRWIEAPYLPARDVRLIADPAAGFAPEIQAEIRHTMVSLLTNGAPVPVLDDPGPEMVGHMMSVCLGEQVAVHVCLAPSNDRHRGLSAKDHATAVLSMSE